MPTLKYYRAEYPLEYCASRFLVQWMRHEQRLHNSISANPDNEVIKDALAYFQVSRSFGGLKGDPEKVGIILQSLS